MNENKNNGDGGGIIGAIVVVVLLVALLGSCSGGTSDYENDLRSGWDKWSNGNYESMSDDEKGAVDDFLRWSNDN